MKKECVLLNMECRNQEEALRALAQTLVDAGAVKESFPDAVVEREKVYPTGLPAKICDIAVPHTIGQHVIEPQMAVGVLKTPVEFCQMGSPEIVLNPRVIIMMAINNPQEQVALLKKLMHLIQDDEALMTIMNAADSAEVVKLIDMCISM